MIRVYVAGAYSANNIIDTLNNMRRGMRLATEVMLAGFAPFCPWMDHHYTFMCRENEQISLQQYYDYSMAWLEASQALLLVPGWENSHGTKEELLRAEDIGIPVFDTIDELKDYFKEEDNF